MATQTLAHLQPGQRLAAARAAAYKKMPYFQAGIQSLVTVESKLPTMGVTRGNHLLVNYDVLAQWSADEAGSVILHEYMHRYLRHAERAEALVRAGILQNTKEDADLWNQAGDAEINDNLIEAGCPLPKIHGMDPITPVSLGLPVNRLAEEYLGELLKRRQNGGGNPGMGGALPPPGWGQCGSGAGNPLPDEPSAQDKDARSEIDQHVQRKSDSESIRKAANGPRGQGKVPSGLQRFANAEVEPAKITWAQQLESEIRSAVQAKAGTGDFTFTARNRMQSALEWMMGDDAPVLPGEHQPLVELAFCWDTSGSMGDREFNLIAPEFNEITKHMGGAKITFIAIDTKIHSMQRVQSLDEIRPLLKGGGGTSFHAAFKALDHYKPRPNIIVFATDGYADVPEEPLPGVETIWLIVNGQKPCEWGREVHVTSEEADAA